ncbi:MAG TPA: diguanylate cyclase [Variovorax sp.]|nr:diguanylate cyclase [Variovorax sp.]
MPLKTRVGARLPRQLYLPRILGCGLGGLSMAAALREGTAPGWIWALLAFVALVWPHVAYLWASRAERPSRAEKRNLMIEALMIGATVCAIGGNLVPSAVALAIVCMNNMSVGGLRLCGWGLLAAAAGAFAMGSVVPFRFSSDSSMLVQLAVLPVILMYLPAFGWTTHRLSRTLHRSREALRRASQIDALSGLYNRRTFEVGFHATFQGLAEADDATGLRPARRPVALVLCDVDHFKRINDGNGHATGDAVIRSIGESLRTHVQLPHVAARYGGDEFALLLLDHGPDEARAFVERLWSCLDAEASGRAQVPPFTISTGIACFDASIENVDDWMARADEALYEVKRRARGGICVARGAMLQQASN